MSYTICSRFKGEHIVYAGYTICTLREHIVYGTFCGSTVPKAEKNELEKCSLIRVLKCIFLGNVHRNFAYIMTKI